VPVLLLCVQERRYQLRDVSACSWCPSSPSILQSRLPFVPLLPLTNNHFSPAIGPALVGFYCTALCGSAHPLQAHLLDSTLQQVSKFGSRRLLRMLSSATSSRNPVPLLSLRAGTVAVEAVLHARWQPPPDVYVMQDGGFVGVSATGVAAVCSVPSTDSVLASIPTNADALAVAREAAAIEAWGQCTLPKLRLKPHGFADGASSGRFGMLSAACATLSVAAGGRGSSDAPALRALLVEGVAHLEAGNVLAAKGPLLRAADVVSSVADGYAQAVTLTAVALLHGLMSDFESR
jgi:hypothetical protein